jgi:hypothetical protein
MFLICRVHFLHITIVDVLGVPSVKMLNYDYQYHFNYLDSKIGNHKFVSFQILTSFLVFLI